MCPQTISRGCTRSSAAVIAVEPTCSPPLVRSPYPRGGPWATTMSVSAGIASNFDARNSSPLLAER